MWTTLGREQKVAFGLLIVLGISGLILGTVYFRNRVQISLAIVKNNFTTPSESESVIDLQQRDTDKDGLSDYDEIYFYGTSPYIEDTDSDGFLDKEEIDEGEDPNCVRGESCGGDIDGGASQTDGSGITPFDILEPQNFDEPIDALKSIDAATLRNLLRESGLTEDVLEQISDEQLGELYQSTITQTEQETQK